MKTIIETIKVVEAKKGEVHTSPFYCSINLKLLYDYIDKDNTFKYQSQAFHANKSDSINKHAHLHSSLQHQSFYYQYCAMHKRCKQPQKEQGWIHKPSFRV